MIHLVIIDLEDILKFVKHLLLVMKDTRNIDPKVLLEDLMQFNHTEHFDLNFWAYIETVLTPDELDRVDPSRINNIVDLTFDNLEKSFESQLGVSNIKVTKVVYWSDSEACLAVELPVHYE